MYLINISQNFSGMDSFSTIKNIIAVHRVDHINQVRRWKSAKAITWQTLTSSLLPIYNNNNCMAHWPLGSNLFYNDLLLMNCFYKLLSKCL